MNYGLHSYLVALDIRKEDYPFYALIAAAMYKADTENTFKLRSLYPDLYDEVQARHNAPGGKLEGD